MWQYLVLISLGCLLWINSGITAPTAVAPTIGCANENFTLVADKCLYFDGRWSDWYQAEHYCRTLDAGLLSFQNESQFEKIIAWILEVARYRKFWTSGNNVGNESVYYWQSTGQKATYVPWAEDQPQRDAGNCLMLYASEFIDWEISNYRLVVRNCSWWGPHICEQKQQTVQLNSN